MTLKSLFIISLYVCLVTGSSQAYSKKKSFLLKTINIQTLEQLGGGYAKDSWNVYYKDRVLKDVSTNSFKYTGNGYAKDNWKSYYKGKTIAQ